MAPLQQALQSLSFLPLRLVLKAITPLQLPPFKGSALRGGFGHAFKETVCVVEHRECPRCLLRTRCAYPYVFDTPVPDGATRMRKYTQAPHPFVLLPPLEEKTRYEPGDSLAFDLTLIGRGSDFLPYFLYTFERLGERRGIGRGRGRFAVDSALWRPPDGCEVPIYRGDDKVLHSTFRSVTVEDLPYPKESIDHTTLIFLTPTRVVFGEHLTSTLDFHVVIRTLLRRVSNLAYFHAGTELSLDFRALIAEAQNIETVSSDLRWIDWERYSARQDTRMRLGGIVGQVTFGGNLQEFLPLLRLGEYIHMGKGTSFGLGKYRMEID
jgi:CRISPR-associated endoribonuclease Cas6